MYAASFAPPGRTLCAQPAIEDPFQQGASQLLARFDLCWLLGTSVQEIGILHAME